jgi:hypothetical protein
MSAAPSTIITAIIQWYVGFINLIHRQYFDLPEVMNEKAKVNASVSPIAAVSIPATPKTHRWVAAHAGGHTISNAAGVGRNADSLSVVPASNN